MRVYVLLTAYKEQLSIARAVEQIIIPNKDLWADLKLIVVAPDEPTLKVAEEVCQRHNFVKYALVKDLAKGKPAAIEMAVKSIQDGTRSTQEDKVIVLTDGDVYVENGSIKKLLNHFTEPMIGGVGGHPVSLDDKASFFGYISHLFCEAAHVRRSRDPFTPMSGYLYAIRLLPGIFPLDPATRAEDAYISQKILALGYNIGYEPVALVYVKFPKNLTDWFKQKSRSLGGNIQLSKLGLGSARSISQDFSMALFPLRYARTPREVYWSLLLYPLRFLLWFRIYSTNAFNRYKTGAWERIESSK